MSRWCGGRRSHIGTTLLTETGFGTRRGTRIENEKGMDREPRKDKETVTEQKVKIVCLAAMSGVETWTGQWTKILMDIVAEIDKENEAEMGTERGTEVESEYWTTVCPPLEEGQKTTWSGKISKTGLGFPLVPMRCLKSLLSEATQMMAYPQAIPPKREVWTCVHVFE